MRRSLKVGKPVLVPMCALGVVVLAACSSSPSAGSGGATTAAQATTAANQSSPAAQAPASTAAATTAAATTQAAAATAPDPCAMVTKAEAGALFGTTFAAGKEEDWGTGGKGCTYSSPTLQIVTVQTARAQSAAEAQASWAEQQAQVPAALQQAAQAHITTHVTPLPGYGDRAALLSGSANVQGVTLSVSGIYLLKGATFVAFEGLAIGHPAPSASALEAQATTVLGRIG